MKVRQMIYKICMIVFEITLPLFMIMGAVLVFTQLVGALTGNGAVVLGINNALEVYSIWTASICAFSGFIMGYVKPARRKAGRD